MSQEERERERERERVDHTVCVTLLLLLFHISGEADVFYKTMADEIGLDFKSVDVCVRFSSSSFLSSYSVYQYGHCRV